jgi:alkyldihydroxyacetonephosphate synthase
MQPEGGPTGTVRTMPIARPSDPRPQISWSGWGDPTQATILPDDLLRLLTDALGVRGPTPRPASIEEIAITTSRLSKPIESELAAIVGDANARSDHNARVQHAQGRSTPDLLRLRAGATMDAPDLILMMPQSHEQVLEILRVCSQRRIAVVPFGGGTSVVGGVTPQAGHLAGIVALDLRRMNALLELDEDSRLAVFEPGLLGPEAEALVSARGYTIGHFPQSFQYATLGGFAATRSSGQASAGYGRFDDLVLAMRVATPAGTLTLGRAPRSAAGPDLRQLLLGSEGALGVITSLTLQIAPVPERRVYQGWRFDSFARGAAVFRALMQDGPVPTVLRLSDEAETALNLARPAELRRVRPGGCLAILGYEGTEDDVERRCAQAGAILEAAGAQPVAGAGDSWAKDRFRGPYLRDALLDAGALVETLETVTFWSSLGALYAAVRDALRASLSAQGTPPLILCHISHVYITGASLYFTVGCAQLEDPQAQWAMAKTAASDAILAAGGSISHHHGVGADHLRWYEREIGALAMRSLAAVKASLDPAGILNPGILIAP